MEIETKNKNPLRVKFFEDSEYDLEYEINHWLMKNNDIKIEDIKITRTNDYNQVFIFYKEL